MNDPSPLDAIREQTGKIEDFLDTLSDPVKPYVISSSSHTPPSMFSIELPKSSLSTNSTNYLVCRYLPAIGRFLIVVTFLEDALRIITQWSDQLLYLHDYRHSTL